MHISDDARRRSSRQKQPKEVPKGALFYENHKRKGDGREFTPRRMRSNDLTALEELGAMDVDWNKTRSVFTHI